MLELRACARDRIGAARDPVFQAIQIVMTKKTSSPLRVGIGGPVGSGKTALTLANLLTLAVTDPNANTPEFKGFLVKLEKL